MSKRVTEEILSVESPDGTKRTVAAIIQEEPAYPEQWKIDANACYRNAVSNVLALAIAGLTLPLILATALLPEQGHKKALFDYVGINFPTALALPSMIFLGIAIWCGVAYFHASAEWVKRACGRKRSSKYRDMSSDVLEERLNWYFRGVVGLAVLGVVLAIAFGLFFTPTYAKEIGKYQAPTKVEGKDAYELDGKVYSYTHKYKTNIYKVASMDFIVKEGNKKIDVQVYKYDQNTNLYKLVASNKTMGWITKSTKPMRDYTILDTDCDGIFDTKLANDIDFDIPDCLKDKVKK